MGSSTVGTRVPRETSQDEGLAHILYLFHCDTEIAKLYFASCFASSCIFCLSVAFPEVDSWLLYSR